MHPAAITNWPGRLTSTSSRTTAVDAAREAPRNPQVLTITTSAASGSADSCMPRSERRESIPSESERFLAHPRVTIENDRPDTALSGFVRVAVTGLPVVHE